MSWFDTSNFANIAKSALKEAQKTIDKALDIKEDTSRQSEIAIDVDSGTLCQDWQMDNRKIHENSNAVICNSNISGSASIWGSLTGSFYDVDHLAEEPKENQTPIDCLEDLSKSDLEDFNLSKLVIQKSDDQIIAVNNSTNLKENVNLNTVERKNILELHNTNNKASDEPITCPPSTSTSLFLRVISNPFKERKLSASNIIDIPLDSSKIGDVSLSHVPMHLDETISVVCENNMESSSKTTDGCNSFYLKNLLADAINEPKLEMALHLEERPKNVLAQSTELVTGERMSFSSSESHSELTKFGSDHTSGHTSGDDIETTTSSDIEIINGCDTSSTHSRQSPACRSEVKSKNVLTNIVGHMVIKGHSRELSEASSNSDECELERTKRRLLEESSILEQKERKLVEITRLNFDLQEINTNLRIQLDSLNNKQLSTVEISQVAQEYTQRLSALEKKFQQAIRDRDSLKGQLEHAKKEYASRITKDEYDQLIAEKDQLIRELREEGETLSKSQLQQSNTIKKLRLKEKEQESLAKKMKESVEELMSETERLNRSLAAKEDIERSQIQTIHQLTTRNKKFEHEVSLLQGSNEDLMQKYESVKKSLDAVKNELINKNKTTNELQLREQQFQTLETSKKITEAQNEKIMIQLEDLRCKLLFVENDFVQKEQKLRLENAELIRRLENAESRNEELSQSVLEMNKPLIRQIETLQASYNSKVNDFEKLEKEYTLKIDDLLTKIHSFNEVEICLKEENFSLKQDLIQLRNEMTHWSQLNEQLTAQLEEILTKNTILEENSKKYELKLQNELTREKQSLANLQKEFDCLEHCLNVERENHAKEMAKYMNLDMNNRNTPTTLQENLNEKGDSHSPTFSGLASMAEENVDVGSFYPCTNILEIELLQSNLKQREGDKLQMQWELSRRERERLLLNAELTSLLQKTEDLEKRCKDLEGVNDELSKLQQKYDTLCQLLGEKVEEAEELKLDLLDVKEMYKSQVDDLLEQLHKNK